MKKFLLFLFSFLIGGGLFWWILKTVGWGQIWLVFKTFSIQSGIIILALTVASVLIRSWRWKTILKSQGYNIPVLKVLEYYISGNSISFLMPMVIFGGEIFRGYDLKDKYSMPWSKSIASVIIDRILEITIYSIIIILGVIFFICRANFPSKEMGLIIFLIVFIIIVLMAIFYFRSFRKKSIIPFFFKKKNGTNSTNPETVVEIEKEILKYFRPKEKTMWEGFGFTVLSETALLFRTILLILFFGKSIGILSAVSILGFSSIATLLPIPAAIGSHEAVQTFVFTGLGLGAGAATAFTMILRGADLVVALFGVVFLFRFGFQFAQLKLNNNKHEELGDRQNSL